MPGYLQSFLSIGQANGEMQIPALSCEPMGSDYVLVAQGQDVNVLVVEGHVTMEICGYQGPGRYTATGPDAVRFTLQTSRTEPIFQSAEDTSCEVCVNPDGKTGGFLCQNLRNIEDPGASVAGVNGSFACAG